jgi:phosphatidylglycerophosphatase A
MKPDLRFLFAHPAHFIALGFGSGLSPAAPGTAGTLAAWLLLPAASRRNFSDAGFLLFLLAAFILGVFAAAAPAGRWAWSTTAPSSGTRSCPSGWCC